MVKRVKQLSREAFTLIELIFAIIIIAISVMSLPMMIQVNNTSIENSMVQEAIFASSAELMNASAGYWDLNSMQDNNLSNLSRVIDIGFNCNNDNNSTRFRLRPGHIAQPLHRRCLDSNITDANNSTNAIFPNLNNAHNVASKVMFTDNITEATGYKETYRSKVSVYINPTNNNVKNIDINVTDSSGNLVTVLKMQSANIGEIDYYMRTLY